MNDRVGYRRPPRHSRFKKGQSGNPSGRPRGRKPVRPYDAILGMEVTVRENGEARRVTAAEAFLLHLVKRGLDGDTTAAMLAGQAIGSARTASGVLDEQHHVDVIHIVGANFLIDSLTSLRMGRILHRYQPHARCKLEPWIVEAALARLTEPLSVEDQTEVLQTTRTPHKVRWPSWWSVRPKPVDEQ